MVAHPGRLRDRDINLNIGCALIVKFYSCSFKSMRNRVRTHRQTKPEHEGHTLGICKIGLSSTLSAWFSLHGKLLRLNTGDALGLGFAGGSIPHPTDFILCHKNGLFELLSNLVDSAYIDVPNR